MCAYIYTIRSIFNVLTILSPTDNEEKKLLPLFLLGSECDLIFSGHFAVSFYMSLFLSEISRYFFIIPLTQTVTRSHYTIDIVVAAMVVIILFHVKQNDFKF